MTDASEASIGRGNHQLSAGSSGNCNGNAPSVASGSSQRGGGSQVLNYALGAANGPTSGSACLVLVTSTTDGCGRILSPIFNCEHCGWRCDRDHNAALNLKQVAPALWATQRWWKPNAKRTWRRCKSGPKQGKAGDCQRSVYWTWQSPTGPDSCVINLNGDYGRLWRLCQILRLTTQLSMRGTVATARRLIPPASEPAGRRR